MIPYMVGKLAANSSHLTRGLVKHVPGRVHFRADPSQNGDKYVTSRPPAIVELVLARVTYNTAITACGRIGQAKRAVELLTEIREAGLVPDAISFNSAITGYARTGR